jgi:phenylalanyl-tRNA synthetase beta chain
MKISLAWMNSHIDRPVTAQEAERVLMGVGFPVDSVTAAGDDWLLDVEVTSNRPDCLCHRGVAREMAAASGRELLERQAPAAAPAGPPAWESVSVRNHVPDLCPLYTARVIRGVRVGPSPAWLRERLLAIGAEPINNVADVTNFVLMELGQPLHAFDLSRVRGAEVHIRMARRGERMPALNGETYELTPEHLVIADGRDPAALAGVMGGEASKVSEGTRDILLEAAIFDVLTVRRAVRSLKVRVHGKPGTESSHRFERGLDPTAVEKASELAASLICEVAGGSPAPGAVRVGVAPLPDRLGRRIDLRISRCSALLGVPVAPDRVLHWLTLLGLRPRPAGEGVVRCDVPSHRLDLEREVDLIEEVARMQGLDAIPVRDRIEVRARAVQPAVAGRRAVGALLASHGYCETVTLSRLREDIAQAFVEPGETVAPLYAEHHRDLTSLRPSLLPSLLLWRRSNQNAGVQDVRLFEAASVWSVRGEQRIERRRLGLLRDAGEDAEQAWRDLRGTVEELVERVTGLAGLVIQPVEHALYLAAAEVALPDGSPLGRMGLLARQPDGLSKRVQELFDLATPQAAAELDLERLLSLHPPVRHAAEPPRFPGIERDLTLVVPEPVYWAQIERCLSAAAPELLEGVTYLTTYRGKPIAPGSKALSLRLFFRDPGGTLRHERVDPQVALVVERLRADLNAELRA